VRLFVCRCCGQKSQPAYRDAHACAGCWAEWQQRLETISPGVPIPPTPPAAAPRDKDCPGVSAVLPRPAFLAACVVELGRLRALEVQP
jgi:hypothetical protein